MSQTEAFCRLFTSQSAPHWKTIGIKAHHGINVPLFSLHSHASAGIGEYPDLIPLIAWCSKVGFNIIQLLPLNDTGIDTSPYSAISSNALNPIHLGLTHLPLMHDFPELKEQLEALKKLNTTKRINYKTVREGKELFLRLYFQHIGATHLASAAFQQFRAYNPWLLSYALFKTLKIHFHWQNWKEWPEPWRDLSSIDVNALPKEMQHEIDFHVFVQFLCFQQMEEVKHQASSHHIYIKGDIPILINMESADVWFDRKLFILDYTAGAPPDMYAKKGQNWGFPLYNWEALKNEFYQWWIERLKVASHYYHLYRIDHIVGFYRIWAIEAGQTSNHGTFLPEDKASWIPNGESIMSMMLNNCSMLPIGEDLGDVPPEVRANLKSLGICGTKVMRWEKRWETDEEYIDPADYCEESMTTISTHDSETLELWWMHHPKEARLFAKTINCPYLPKLTKEIRQKILKASHRSASLFHINLLQEYLALLPQVCATDPADERINTPGTVSNKNWTYRFCPSVEEIVNSCPLKAALSEILPH